MLVQSGVNVHLYPLKNSNFKKKSLRIIADALWIMKNKKPHKDFQIQDYIQMIAKISLVHCST